MVTLRDAKFRCYEIKNKLFSFFNSNTRLYLVQDCTLWQIRKCTGSNVLASKIATKILQAFYLTAGSVQIFHYRND